MRVLLLAAAAGLALTTSPALANDPIDWGYECVRYPCYPTDYPPYLLDQSQNVVTVEFNPGYVCVTEPCEQPPLVTVCVVPLSYCTPR